MVAVLFSVGFRPFFLAAAWLAVVWMAAWTAVLALGAPAPTPLPPVLWHSHEMLFGFTAAVIAGFLLTAVQNWTGRTAARPVELAALVALWAAARVGFLLPDTVPLALTTLLDLAFFPLLAALLARTLLPARNRRNYAFLPLLGAFTLLNGGMHLALHDERPALAIATGDLTVWLVVVLLVFMSGRVVPAFTGNRLPGAAPRQWPALNWAATLTTLLVLPAYLIAGRAPVLAALLAPAALLTLARALAWRPWRTGREPLLWILHAGSLWIPVGLGLQAAHLLGAAVPWSAGVHALTTGALGSLTLGMMARVALGHTGRPLTAPPAVVAGFVLMQLAAVVRVPVALLPAAPSWLLGASGALWASAFLLYALVYTPILLRRRVGQGAPARQA